MVRVRPAELSDGTALAAIDEATWSPQVTPAPRDGRDSSFFGDRHDPADVLVAETGGSVVGYLMLHQPLPLPSHAHVLEVNGLAVHPSYQRHGVGRLLMHEATREARRRGARKVTLRVLSPNTPARRLYESCGFIVEGVLRGEFELEGRLVDDVLMARQVED